jgi:hypothetical protein
MPTKADDDAKRFRILAAEALELSMQLTDPHSKAIMLEIAQRYQSLAEYVEARKPVKPVKDKRS